MPTVTFDLADALRLFRFGEIREAIALMESLFEGEAARFDKRVEEQAAGLTDADREDFYVFMADEHWQLYERFPNLLRRSMFLAIYGEIEAYMNRMCDLAQKHRGLPSSYRDRKGSGIERARQYLEEVAGYNLISSSREWQYLTGYNKLRNVIAHNESRLRKGGKDDSVELFVRRHPLLKLEGDIDIVIEKGFCEEVLDTADSLFRQLPRELRL